VVNVCFGTAAQLSVKIGAACSGAVNLDRDYSAGGAHIGSKYLPNDKLRFASGQVRVSNDFIGWNLFESQSDTARCVKA
jgi:hypothetical protein